MKSKDKYLSLLHKVRDAEKRDNSLNVNVELTRLKGGVSRTLSVYSTNVGKSSIVFMVSYFEAEPFSKARSSIRIWAKLAGDTKSVFGNSAVSYLNTLIL